MARLRGAPTARAKSTASDALSHGADTGAHTTSTGRPGPVSASPGWKSERSPAVTTYPELWNRWQVRVDDGVQLGDRTHRQTGVELLPRCHDGQSFGEDGGVGADQLGHRRDGEHGCRRGPQMIEQVVVRVLVGDEHRSRPVTASGSVQAPGSITSATPSCSTRTYACPDFVMRMGPQ
ncbi:MAG: hypothetical protein WKF50_09865 [Nocardioides sp.]